PGDVVLAVEAVSPDSEDRDRDTGPREYAMAGIRCFWRVERDGDRTVGYAYERDPAAGALALTGIHRDRLETSVPFDVGIDPTAVGAGSRRAGAFSPSRTRRSARPACRGSPRSWRRRPPA